jgi:SlyX protein
MISESEARITELEIQLAHLQRLFEQLNDVVTQQAGRVDQLAAAQKKLEEKLNQARAAESESVDPLDEKPPHY